MAGLEALGIDPTAEAVYRRLAAEPVCSRAELVETTPVDPTELAAVLDRLCSLGLAAPAQGGWRALPLSLALPMLHARRTEELSAAVAAAEALQAQIYAPRAHSSDGEETLIGREAIGRARRDLCSLATTSIEIFDRPPFAYPLQNEQIRTDSPEYLALQRGITMRTVYHPGFDARRLSGLQTFVQAGENARIAAIPIKLMLFDARIALIPSLESYGEGREPRAAVMHHPIVVEALVSLFRRFWEQAVPISSTEVTPRHEGLVALLMTGATDAVIAHRLGVTERSVRRWVADLMERHGVRTRLQLGAALGAREYDAN